MLAVIALLLTGMLVLIPLLFLEVIPYYIGGRERTYGDLELPILPFVVGAIALDIGVIIGLITSIGRRMIAEKSMTTRNRVR